MTQAVAEGDKVSGVISAHPPTRGAYVLTDVRDSGGPTRVGAVALCFGTLEVVGTAELVEL